MICVLFVYACIEWYVDVYIMSLYMWTWRGESLYIHYLNTVCNVLPLEWFLDIAEAWFYRWNKNQKNKKCVSQMCTQSFRCTIQIRCRHALSEYNVIKAEEHVNDCFLVEPSFFHRGWKVMAALVELRRTIRGILVLWRHCLCPIAVTVFFIKVVFVFVLVFFFIFVIHWFYMRPTKDYKTQTPSSSCFSSSSSSQHVLLYRKKKFLWGRRRKI